MPNNVPFPTRFRCKVGDEYKALADFSDNQQKLVLRLKDIGGRVDAAHSGMTCMVHASSAASSGRCELQCTRCGLTKSLDYFSKNARRMEDPECKRCVAWCETQEPDVTPAALETGHIAYEELAGETWNHDIDECADAAPDYFGADIEPLAPVTELSELGLQDGASSRDELLSVNSNSDFTRPVNLMDSDTGTTYSTKDKDDLPAPLVGSLELVSEQESSSRYQAATGQGLPPHLRSRGGPRSTASGSISTATTMRDATVAGEKTSHMLFNAWDSGGRKHLQDKSPTVVSSTDSYTSGNELANSSDSRGGNWQKVENKMPVKPTDKRKGKWPTARETRLSRTEIRRLGEETTTLRNISINPNIDRQRPSHRDAARDFNE